MWFILRIERRMNEELESEDRKTNEECNRGLSRNQPVSGNLLKWVGEKKAFC